MIKDVINSIFVDEKSEVLNLYEKYKLCKEKDIVLFGNYFYTPNVWRWVEKSFGEGSLKIDTYGLFEESERRMICFNNKYFKPFPMKCIKITNKSKFTELKHKDYLGSILGLGIERNRLGDLIIDEKCCYAAVHLDIVDFILYNLTKIGNTVCKVEIIDNENEFPKVDFKEEVILISSLRIDSVVGKLCSITRSKAVSAIEQGLVLADYNVIRDKSYELKKDERLTIRKKGKFIIGDIVGNSKSGKIKLLIKKYT